MRNMINIPHTYIIQKEASKFILENLLPSCALCVLSSLRFQFVPLFFTSLSLSHYLTSSCLISIPLSRVLYTKCILMYQIWLYLASHNLTDARMLLLTKFERVKIAEINKKLSHGKRSTITLIPSLSLVLYRKITVN